MTLVHVEREAVTRSQGGGLRRWIQQRHRRRADEIRANWLVRQFTQCMHQTGLARDTFSAAGIAGTRVPVVTSIVLGPAPRLFIRPLPGQLLGDFEDVASRIASALQFDRVRLSQRRNGLLRCDLVKVDPLGVPVDQPVPLRSVHERFVLGRAESGEVISVSLVDIAHLIFQGMTRSGKSRMTYSMLAQLAGCPDLVIAGSDITGILLRPFVGTRHADYQALGAEKLEQHVEVFEGLVELMHQRHERIPPRRDVLPVTELDPIVLAVIEEYGVLVDVLGAHDTQHKTKLQARFRSAVRSLMAGGAKVGFRVLLITQRADAAGPAGVGAFERGQAAVRITFRVDTHEAAKMLHPGIAKEAAEAHAHSPAGIALLSGPELPLVRLRSPSISDYGQYADLVATACRTQQAE